MSISTLPDRVPFARGTMRMGLSPIDASAWIRFGDDADAQLAEKRRLLATRRDAVLAALPGSEASAAEALDVLVANLRRFHPDRLGPGTERESPDEHPLAIAARLVPEDFCVLERGETGFGLTAGCVCFPSNWNLREKLGLPLQGIHAPVPGYADTLAAPVDRFFERLTPHHLVARLNWLVHDNPAMFQRGRMDEPPVVTAQNAGEVLWLRLERQVLQRLPRTGAVLFTIRTHLHRLRDAVRSAGEAGELAAALRAMPPDLQSYRHMQPFAAPLLAWLDARAAGA